MTRWNASAASPLCGRVGQRLDDLPRLALPPVILRRPVAREFLNRRRLYALRLISDSLLADEARRLDPSPKVVQLLVRHVELEGANLECGLDGGAHDDLLANAVSGTLRGSPR